MEGKDEEENLEKKEENLERKEEDNLERKEKQEDGGRGRRAGSKFGEKREGGGG